VPAPKTWRDLRDNALKALMGGVCAYELAALISEWAGFEQPQTLSVLIGRSKVLKGALAAGYVVLGVHVGYLVKGSEPQPTPAAERPWVVDRVARPGGGK
jgi:hypothetical protein